MQKFSAARNFSSEIHLPPLDHLHVQDGDLPGRAAETDESQLRPEEKRLTKEGPFGETGGSFSSVDCFKRCISSIVDSV